VVAADGKISATDLDLITVTDDVDEALAHALQTGEEEAGRV
jgi:hypothetical protein